MKKILVTSADRLDMILSAASCYDIQVDVLDHRDSSKQALKTLDALNIPATHYTYECDPEAYSVQLADRIKSGIYDLVVSTSGYDDRVLAEALIFDQHREHGVPLFGHPTPVVWICNNKSYTKAFCKTLGVNATQSFPMNTNNIPLDLPYPLVIKKESLWSGKGIEVVKSRTEHTNCSIEPPYFCEPFVDAMEVSVNAFSHNGQHYILPITFKGKTSTDLCHPLEKLRICYIEDTPSSTAIKEASDTIISALNGSGWYDLEFLVTKDRAMLMEINCRYSGLTKLNHLSTGINPYDITFEAALKNVKAASTTFVSGKNIVIEVPFTEKINSYNMQQDEVTIEVHYSTTMKNSLGRVTIAAQSFEVISAYLSQLLCPDDYKKFYADLVAYNEELLDD
ncbi:hypothetical protein AB4563_24615 [Vibrio splendidus]|uniref:ATP-grasp domain-containing protein n=1 Tax=Vibrio splendidus TaxID=29497 RepID=A0ABV4LN15_VIBSP